MGDGGALSPAYCLCPEWLGGGPKYFQTHPEPKHLFKNCLLPSGTRQLNCKVDPVRQQILAVIKVNRVSAIN